MPAMTSASRTAAAIAVAILSIAIAAVIVLNLAGAPIGQGPGPTSSSTPSLRQSAEATASPTSVAADDQLRAFAQIEAQVRDIRGLPAPEIGQPELITRDQLGAEVEAILDESWTPEELRRANLTLLAMGLLEEGQDIRELTARLLNAQVAGFYDPYEERMVVITESGLTPETQVYFAHEYTHALQDGAFGIVAEQDRLTDDDAIAASQALTEGDASILMVQWAVANLDPAQLAQIGSTPLPDTTGIPDWMVSQLLWPYLAGIDFLSAVSGLSLVPGAGAVSGWAAVDDVYDDPPASTEQVIHPDKYRAREAPLEVEAPPIADHLGSGWQDLEPNTMGEALIDTWLGELGSTSPTAVAAAGWGGDRLVVAEGPNDGWAMAWSIAWDSAADADEFQAAYRATAAHDGYVNRLLRTSSTESLVLHASSTEVLTALADGLGR